MPLASVLNWFHCSCSQTQWQVISIENQRDLIIGLVLVDYSGSKALISLRTVFHIVNNSIKALFTNCEALYHQVQTNSSELTETSYWPITENTHFVQLLIAYRNKSAVSNITWICFESSLLFFSTS